MQSRYDRRRFLCNAIMTLGATELSIEEKQAYDQLVFSYKHVGYAVIMGSRPQTLMGTADSPIGLATMFVDHISQVWHLSLAHLLVSLKD